MAASLNTVLFLFFCQLQSGSAADPQRIQQMTVQPGENVTLPCEAPNVNITTVEWNRPGLEKHVYMKRDGHLMTADQDPSYVNRVQLEDDEMKNGELSLILKNVNNNDTGTYKCLYVEERGGRRKRADQRKLSITIVLKVKDGESRDGRLGVPLPVTLIAALVAVGLVGFVIYKKRKGRSGI